jgi:hypothetical protein
MVLLGAIASHKLISGLALSSRFLKEGATNRQVLACVGPFALVAPTAVAVGAVVRDVNPMLTLVLSCFATGTFLYVGMSEIVEVGWGRRLAGAWLGLLAAPERAPGQCLSEPSRVWGRSVLRPHRQTSCPLHPCPADLTPPPPAGGV